MDSDLILIILVVVFALSFDFINGFHDTANVIATSVSTRALTPRRAIVLAASMNFIGAIIFTGVAKTIGGQIADPMQLENGMVITIAALIAAIVWNLLTWWLGIPSSSSHALIGSIAGAVIAAAGIQSINWSGFIGILYGLVISPVIALALGFIVMRLLQIALKRVTSAPHQINSKFRLLQMFTAGLQAFAHGTNDAQKVMGIITFALVAGGYQSNGDIQLWVRISASLAMALGTAVGGWRIIKTVGGKIMKIEPVNGAAADVTSAIIIFIFTKFGLPVSSTHVISSAIMGVGSAKRIRAVKWGTARKIVITWLVTLPGCLAISMAVYGLIYLFS